MSAGSLRDVLVDTNYLSSQFRGAARPVHVKSRICHCVTPQQQAKPIPLRSHPRAAAFFSFLKARTFSSEVPSTTSATERYEPASA